VIKSAPKSIQAQEAAKRLKTLGQTQAPRAPAKKP
jgi:hypothetical protein